MTQWNQTAHLAYAAEVREICRLAGRPELAVGYIERGTSETRVLAEMVELVFGRKMPKDAALEMAPWPDLFLGLGLVDQPRADD